MHDDESILTLAKEALDWNALSEAYHKQRKHPSGADMD